MNYKVCSDTIVLRVDRGEEVIAALKQVCEQEKVTLATINGIGAVDRVELGIYDGRRKKYALHTLEKGMEMTSLTGNITEKDGTPYIHVHATFADVNGQVLGGHLNSTHICGACEIFIRKLEGKVGRHFDENIGLNIMTFENCQSL